MTYQHPVAGPPIRTEVVLTEDGRGNLTKGALRTVARSWGVWILLVGAVLYVAFFFVFVGAPAGVVILIVVVAAVALIASRIRSRTRLSMQAIPAGTVQRAEFGASDFTYWVLRPTTNALLGQSFLTTRLMVLRDYAEIKNVVVNDNAVGILFSARPGTREAFPRALFPDEALALMSRYTKVTGKWSPLPAPTN
ncbi:hypothetical protein [Mycobacteroides salmoniphilum]|uniref:Uncharacterized protein n=1 Tax=Mycobacteroides salmoniphilum TaxID=404941 RepID=A0A4V3HYZ9_9MYCO|nr:hypothetical protein [Mycobacteroides salmoniphilum]TDZ90182.1 hypothetical protein CCUG60885_04828 [Mycobacteroides salmoniphilum]TEA00148.1 hypothetical protein CCUG60883_04831 [Mycobacteroides salmoniphilum]